jgi:hypothetical protein
MTTFPRTPALGSVPMILKLVALLVLAMPVAALAEPGRVPPREQTLHVTQGLSTAGSLRASRTHAVRLPPPADSEARMAPPAKGAPLQVGFGRAVRELESEAATGAALDWQALGDGRMVAAISIVSPSAAALRTALRIARLPDAALLRFASADGTVFEVPGREVNAAIERNEAAGEQGRDTRLYWSPVAEGDTFAFEIELPAGGDPRDLRISIPHVSHLVASAGSAFATPTTLGQSAACEVDAMCASGWANERNAVAQMIFSSGSGSFLCTGTLLADGDPNSNAPFFLSANHCIGTQSAASSLTTYWFYRSTQCGSGTPGQYRQLTGGATLLHGNATTDTAFMRLNNIPPQGTFYAGWMAATPPAIGTAVTALHQPRGDLLKASQGAIRGYFSCTAPVNGSFECDNASSSTAGFYEVDWSSGLTEPGSSGSGIFRDDGSLIGQLYGGSSDCRGGSDVYGRFDVAYANALKTWLAPRGNLTVTTSGNGGGSISSMPAGIQCGATCSASFPAGSTVVLTASPLAGSAFSGWSGACSGSSLACSVTVQQATTVTASFALTTPTLSVQVAGSGRITSTPAGIDCTGSCAAPYPFGTSVTLNAIPSPGNVFAGWSGACSGAGNCTVSIAGSVTVTAAFSTTTPPPSSAARLFGISTRGQVLTGNDVMIGGFIVGGTAPKTVIVRARGPSLAAAGIGNALGDPTLRLVRSADQATIAANDDWGAAGNAAAITASGFAPSNAFESAILATLAPGAYTAIVSGVGGLTGVALMEVFEVDAPEGPLAALSTRGIVQTGNDVMIAGFVIQGSGPQNVVIRARGPSLAPGGIPNFLANPTLQVVRSADQAVIASNDDWDSGPTAGLVSANNFAPPSGLESAVYLTLQPGAYTAIVSGLGGGTGVAVVEVFAAP